MTMTLEPRVPEAVSLDLPFSPESARVARGALHSWLDSVDAADETRDDARLLISELVGNSVRHARPLDDELLRVEWRLEANGAPSSLLAIKVTDGGAGTVPSVVDAGTGDTCGRGLAIVEHLAARWWVEGSGSGVTVVAEIPLA